MDADLSGWQAALDRLEADLVSYQALLEAPDAEQMPAQTPEWTPPEGLGPIPVALVPRARAVLEQQDGLRGRLGAALHANTRQRGLAARITGATTTPSVPTYLDVTA